MLSNAISNCFVSISIVQNNMPLEFNDILFNNDTKGQVKIEVIYEGESFWLNQKKWWHCLMLKAIDYLSPKRNFSKPRINARGNYSKILSS